MTIPHSRNLNHVGITVPDIYRAMDWYMEVLGCTHLMGPRVLDAGNQQEKRAAIIMGSRFRKAYQVQLATANGVGIELFQFVDPAVERYGDENMEYWKQGYWHLCYTDPNIEELAERITATGGRMRTQIFDMVPGLPYKLAYAEDPFGNVLEICSHSHAEAWSNWPHRGMDWDIVLYHRDGTESVMPNPYNPKAKA